MNVIFRKGFFMYLLKKFKLIEIKIFFFLCINILEGYFLRIFFIFIKILNIKI